MPDNGDMAGMDPTSVVSRFWEEVWTEGRAEILPELCGTSFTENGEATDVAEFQKGIVRWRQVFPDFKVRIEEMLAFGDDRVVSRVTYSGTQRQPWAGLPASGETFEVIGIDIFTVRNGKIIELWHAVDHFDMAVQLGGKLTASSG